MIGSYTVDYKIGVVRFVETLTQAFNRLSRYYDVIEKENGDLYLRLTNCYIYDTNVCKYVTIFGITKYRANEFVKIKFSDGRDVTCDSEYWLYSNGTGGMCPALDLTLKEEFICEDRDYQRGEVYITDISLSSKEVPCFAVETITDAYMLNGINVNDYKRSKE